MPVDRSIPTRRWFRVKTTVTTRDFAATPRRDG
jgi:hypothetical protein